MATEKLPAIQFYTGDWLRDAGCSLGAQGLWLRMMFIAHDSPRYGYLETNGSPTPPETIARRCGCDLAQYETLLSELVEAGVPSISASGVYFSRRMVRDATIREKRRSAGRKGGCAPRSNLEANPDQIVEDEVEAEKAFDLFWERYPRGRKTDKARAREAFAKAARKVPAATLIASAAEYAQSERGRGQYVKMPATWLNGECWNDDREAWKDRDATEPERPPEYRQVARNVFDAHGKGGDFLISPKADTPDARGYMRIFGTLKGGRKIESHTDPDWKPTT